METSQRVSRKLIFGLSAVASMAFLAMALVLFAAFSCAPVASAQGQSGDTAINHDRVVQKDETVDGDVSVTNGNLDVRGKVNGKAVVFNGNVTIEGTVTGDVSVLAAGTVQLGKGAVVGGNIIANGTVVLGPNSKVAGDVSAVGGKVIRDPSSTVGGEITAADISLGGVSNQVVVTPAPAVPVPLAEATVTNDTVVSPARSFASRMLSLFAQGLGAVVLLALGALMVLLIPNRVRLSSATLEAEPGPSIVVGFIAGVLLFPVVALAGIILTISVIGLPFIPVLVVAVLLVMLFGLVTLSSALGRWVFMSAGSGPGITTNGQVGQVLTGMAIILGTTIVPSAVKPGFVSVIMGVVLYFAVCAGLGAAIMSRFGTLAPPKHAAPVYFHNPFGAPGRGTAVANSHFVSDPRHNPGQPNHPNPSASSSYPTEEPAAHTRR